MDVPLEMLLHPELLTNEQLLFIIQERRIRIPNLQMMPRDGLLEVFHHYCVPNKQRNYSDSGRGKLQNRLRPKSPDSNSKINLMHVNCHPRNSEPPEDTYDRDGHPEVFKSTEGIPPIQDIPKNLLVKEGVEQLKFSPSEQTGSGIGGFKYKSYAERKKARQVRRKLAKACVREQETKGTSDKIETRVPGTGRLKRKTTNPVAPSEYLAKRQYRGQSDDSARSSAKRSSELAVAFGRADGALVDEALGAIIRDRILSNMERAIEQDEDDRKLAFATSGLVSEGFFLVTPENEDARDWLLSCDLGEYEGVPIVARKLYRSRVMVWLPGRDKMPTDIIKWLQRQNKGRIELMPNEWTLITKEVLPTGVRLVMGVPSEAGEAWGASQMLHFQLTKVVAKLLGGTSKIPTMKVGDTPAPGQLCSYH